MYISSLCDLFIYQLKDGQKKNGDRNIYLDFSKGINLTDHTAISVFFADLVSVRYRKDIYQNWLSLLGKEHVHFAVVLLLLCCLVNEGHYYVLFCSLFFSLLLFSFIWWYSRAIVGLQFCYCIRIDLLFYHPSIFRSIKGQHEYSAR